LTAGVGLLLVMLLAGALVAHYVTQVTEWRVMTDELLYLKIARGIGDNLSPIPTVHGEHVAVYSVLYPLLIAPVVGLFDAPSAFQVIHVLNVAVMVSTAIPAYLLAREASATRLAALVVGAMSVLVPWMAQSASLMTEAVAYPAYAWAAYGMTRAVAAPSGRRDLAAIAAIAVACLARTEFVFLVVAFPAAAILHEVGRQMAQHGSRDIRALLLDGPRIALREHVVAVVVAGSVVVLYLFASRVLLGSYDVTATGGGLLPSGTVRSVLEHLAYVALGVGALPVVFAAAFVLGTLGRASDAHAHALAAVLVVVVGATAVVVTSFDLRFNGGGVQERYLFYVCPLLFAGAVGWFARPARAVVATGIAAIATAGLVMSRHYDPVGPFDGPASPNRYALEAFDGRLQQIATHLGLSSIEPAIIVAGGCLLAAALAFALVRRGRAQLARRTFGIGMVAFLTVQLVYLMPRAVAEHNSLAQLYFGRAPVRSRDWVDQKFARPTAAVEGVINSRAEKPVWYTFANNAVWWELEFWNHSVDRVFRLGTGSDVTVKPIQQLSLDYASGTLRIGGDRPPSQLAISTSDVRFAPEHQGSPARHGDVALYRTPLPYRADWATQGIREDGWTTGGHPATVRLYARRGEPAELRRVRVVLHGGADIGRARRYTITGPSLRHSAVVRDNTTYEAGVCVPAGGHADVGLDVHGGTELSPGLVVGLRVLLIDTSPTGRTCRHA
jgi:hypothetical protein